MRAGLLDDAAVVQHDQPVHPRDGREPVGDGDHRPPAISASSCSWIAASTSLSSAEVASSSTRIGASFRITRAMAIALALAAGQLDAALADMGVVAAPAVPVLERVDEIVRMRGLARGVDDLRLACASGRP